MVMGMSEPIARNASILTRAAGCWFGLVVVAFVVYTGHIVYGLGGHASYNAFDKVGYNAVMLGGALALIMRAVSMTRDRAAMLLIGFGLLAWALGDLSYTLFYAEEANPPYPA